MEVINTAGLTKYYGGARGIDGLDLTVSGGEFFGFIGPNGAGKSTTIRTLLGLISPTSKCKGLRQRYYKGKESRSAEGWISSVGGGFLSGYAGAGHTEAVRRAAEKGL